MRTESPTHRFYSLMQPAVCLMLLCLFLLYAGLPVRADQKLNYPMTVTQPDGQQLHLLASGDEFFNWLHDSKGYVIIQHPTTGYWVYAQQAGGDLVATKYRVGSVDPARVGLKPNLRLSRDRYEQRVKAKRPNGPAYGDARFGKTPSHDTVNNIVIFVRFQDDAEYTEPFATFNTMWNSETEVSLYSYFKEVSYGQLDMRTHFYPAPNGTRVVSYQDSHPRSYYQPYNAESNTNGYTPEQQNERTNILVGGAIAGIASMVPAALNIDGDNDGYVDNVTLLLAGDPGAWASILWAQAFTLPQGTGSINGKEVYNYNLQICNDVTQTNMRAGVLAHEMFHSLGAPDWYHYSYDGLVPAGPWDVMEQDTFPPQHMSMYSKFMFGKWISTIPEITAAGTYSLNPTTSPTNNCYKIRSAASASEYYMVEYRKKAGLFDIHVPSSGLIVYRINSAFDRGHTEGNRNGPPDEFYIYRPGGTPTANGTINNASFSADVGRTAINDTLNPSGFLTDGTLGGLRISSVSAAGSTITFRVDFTTSTSAQQPDAMIGANLDATGATLKGNGVYNTTAANQTAEQDVNPGGQITYVMRVQNDGTAADSFKVTGTATDSLWRVDYALAATGASITSQVTGTGWTSASLASYAWVDILVTITPVGTIAYGATKTVQLTAQSMGNTGKTDVVKAISTYARDMQYIYYENFEGQFQGWQHGASPSNMDSWTLMDTQAVPETIVASPTHSWFTLDAAVPVDQYLISPTIQIPQTGKAYLSFMHSYQIEYGDGAMLEATTDGTNWNDLGNSMVLGGYNGYIPFAYGYDYGYGNPLAGRDCWFSETAGFSQMQMCVADITAYAGQSVRFRWRIATDYIIYMPTMGGWYIDDIAIQAEAVRRPDAMIRTINDLEYAGDDVYSPTAQTASLTVNPGETAKYFIALESDASLPSPCNFRGTPNGDGWRIRYFLCDTVGESGGNDYTILIGTKGGWDRAVYPGQRTIVRVEVTPEAGAVGLSKAIQFTVTPKSAKLKYDQVTATTTLNVNAQPDMMICNSSDTSYIGSGIYNVDASQTKRQTKATGQKAVYKLKVKNNGEIADSFKITGPATGSGWTIRYFNSSTGGTDITSQVIATAGWSTGTLAVNAEKEFRVEVTGDATVLGSAVKAVRVTATSTASATKHDSVIASTTKAALSAASLTASPASPRITNTSITLTGTATGGGPIEYKFRASYVSNGSTLWPYTRNWATANTCTWRPTVAATYTLWVYARETGTTREVSSSTTYIIRPPLSAVNLTTSLVAPQPVTASIRLTGVATGGGTVEFKFRVGYVQNSVWTWTTLRGYGTYPSSIWKPTVARTYTLQVWAREVGSTASYQQTKSLSYVITPALSAVSISASPASPQRINTAIVLTATKTGGAHVEYLFRAGYQVNGTWTWAQVRQYGLSPTCTWRPATAHTYTLQVWAREVGTTVQYQVTGARSYTVTAQ